MNLRDAELCLEASPDHRILRRVPPVERWPLAPAGADVRRAVYIDVETTGLNHDEDEVIELALLPFDYNRTSGEIVAVHENRALSALRQPSFPIPPASTRVHGVTDADVAGRVIEEAEIARVVDDAHLLIAHNAAFDRPMVEKHWPLFARKHWACSLVDIAWREEGLASAKLDYLLLKQGWFYDGHRAFRDAFAGVFLLASPLPLSKRPALQALLECARRPLKAVRAEGAPYELREIMKQRGYRWDSGSDSARRSKAWWILTEDAEAEVTWLQEEIYCAARSVPVISMPATRRYSARIWDEI